MGRIIKMSCYDCIYSEGDDCNPNNFVCRCQRVDYEDNPNPHYLHILHADHTCLQGVSKDNCIGLKANNGQSQETKDI